MCYDANQFASVVVGGTWRLIEVLQNLQNLMLDLHFSLHTAHCILFSVNECSPAYMCIIMPGIHPSVFHGYLSVYS